MIAVLHAYSRRNAGDGLLVDLTLERLERAGIGRDKCELFALDASSFTEIPTVHQVGVPGRRPTGGMLLSAGQLMMAAMSAGSNGHLALGRLTKSVHGAAAVVAVGGGYLRTGDIISSLGTLLNHVPQLLAASSANVPSFYMPQSIGPLPGPVGWLVRRLLRGIDRVNVRDDTSYREMRPLMDVHRYPDLALMHLAERLDETVVQGASSGGGVVLVGRELGTGATYPRLLMALASRLAAVTWAVQAEGAGSKSDRIFYRKLGVSDSGELVDVLARDSPAAVVSVRLHGAIQALLSGIPAVHLSYQRKGWSAYADIGLEEFVHDANSFDPEAVVRQVETLGKNPEVLWDLVRKKRPELMEASHQLTAELRQVLALR